MPPMSDDEDHTTIHRGTGCLWTDMGYDNAAEMSVKAALAHHLDATLQARGWRHREAAEATGMPAEVFWHTQRGRLDQVSVGEMIEALTRLGCDILIVVGEPENEPGAVLVRGPDDYE